MLSFRRVSATHVPIVLVHNAGRTQEGIWADHFGAKYSENHIKLSNCGIDRPAFDVVNLTEAVDYCGVGGGGCLCPAAWTNKPS